MAVTSLTEHRTAAQQQIDHWLEELYVLRDGADALIAKLEGREHKLAGALEEGDHVDLFDNGAFNTVQSVMRLPQRGNGPHRVVVKCAGDKVRELTVGQVMEVRS